MAVLFDIKRVAPKDQLKQRKKQKSQNQPVNAVAH